jgi:hypothetical protein
VSAYAGFSFVVAFEHTRWEALPLHYNTLTALAFGHTSAPGYVTEKLVNAFLAGAVPVYSGPAEGVRRFFNPAALLDCSAASAAGCARRVQALAADAAAMRRMRALPASSPEQLARLLAWHPPTLAALERLGLLKGGGLRGAGAPAPAAGTAEEQQQRGGGRPQGGGACAAPPEALGATLARLLQQKLGCGSGGGSTSPCKLLSGL